MIRGRSFDLGTCAVVTLVLAIFGSDLVASASPPSSQHGMQDQQDQQRVLHRGDVVNLPGPLQARLVELAGRPHTYLPLKVFAESSNPEGFERPNRTLPECTLTS